MTRRNAARGRDLNLARRAVGRTALVPRGGPAATAQPARSPLALHVESDEGHGPAPNLTRHPCPVHRAALSLGPADQWHRSLMAQPTGSTGV